MSEQEFADFQDDYHAMLKRIGVSPEAVKNDPPKALFGVSVVESRFAPDVPSSKTDHKDDKRMNSDYTAPLAVTVFARFTFYAALLFVVNLLMGGSLSVYLVAVSLYALVIVYQERGKRKRKNSAGDTDNPFHPEYWRDDVPPPPANPGYFEATK